MSEGDGLNGKHRIALPITTASEQRLAQLVEQLGERCAALEQQNGSLVRFLWLAIAEINPSGKQWFVPEISELGFEPGRRHLKVEKVAPATTRPSAQNHRVGWLVRALERTPEELEEARAREEANDARH